MAASASASASSSNHVHLAPPNSDLDVEQGNQAESETAPLLTRPSPASRPSYRKRRISQSYVVKEESFSTRWWVALAGGVVALTAVLLAAALIIARATGPDSGNGKDKDDTPDFSKLPGPQPGLRNPSYLLTGQYGGVATEVDICSKIGVDVLKEGGTAADAAIASALCIGVTNSFSSGIGGGGFMVIRPPSTTNDSSAFFNPNCTEPFAIDFRETAPAASDPFMYAPRKDDPTFDSARASKIGGLAIGVPGELRGLEKAYELCGGGLPWARLVKPSVEIARQWKIGPELARRLSIPMLSGWIPDSHEWADSFAPEGELLKVGEVLKRENYADTLETIAREGPGAFYEGPIADSLVRTISKAGGILTAEDFAAYKANVRPAIKASYRNRTYYVGHAPSGGPVLVNLLNVLEGYGDLIEGGKSGLSVHRFVEAQKFAFGARTEIGDPAFMKREESKKIKEIMTSSYAKSVRANITDDKTHELAYYRPRFGVKEDHGTTHLSVIDQHGSAVSLTSTVNLIFGSRVMDPDTGVILNDEMDDFATPGIPDAFGLQPSPFNFPSGGKRPLSSTSPMIMDTEDGEVFLAAGGSGGSRIFGAVAQVLLNLDWGYDLSNSIEQPRVHHQLMPPYVSIEAGYRPDLVGELETRGHNITWFDINIGISEVQAVMRDPKSGKIYAASDSRKNGIPAAY
ncbi:hypothetical protein T439DRAFT_298311 [Meredithblackwellia eburnea MCA 4105]